MRLNRLDILNFKNFAEAHIEFAAGVNCLVGNNGVGKTNVLDAVYYLSMCKSHTARTDQATIRYGQENMMLQGHYTRREAEERITIGLQRGKRKIVKRGDKEYERLSQHIGLIPIVVVAPGDWDLIRGGGEERRRLLDQIISQTDTEYLEALIRYNRALEHRNKLLRQQVNDTILYESVEHAMETAAEIIFRRRTEFVDRFTPIFLRHYQAIATDDEQVKLTYQSHLAQAGMPTLLNQNRARDLALGFTSVGTHRDDLALTLNNHAMRNAGSQGQCKTYTIALRLAQFEFLKQSSNLTPLLLLDDIFDKLDTNRVERIVEIVAGEQFGQIFITDTNRDHLDRIIANTPGEHRLFHVADNTISYNPNSQ